MKFENKVRWTFVGLSISLILLAVAVWMVGSRIDKLQPTPPIQISLTQNQRGEEMEDRIRFTRMLYVKDGAYKESKECVSISRESLDKAIFRQEGEWWRIIWLGDKDKTGNVEVVKESPLKLLKQGVPDDE